MQKHPIHQLRFRRLAFRPPFLFRGTFAPFSRASLKPIAIACFRLVTLRPDPLFSVPFFFRCIADLTRLPAAFPYFAIATLPFGRACKACA